MIEPGVCGNCNGCGSELLKLTYHVAWIPCRKCQPMGQRIEELQKLAQKYRSDVAVIEQHLWATGEFTDEMIEQLEREAENISIEPAFIEQIIDRVLHAKRLGRHRRS